MTGFDVAAGAVGIASLGIQVCQGLLSYYHDWRDFKSDISGAYDAISDLAGTLDSLKRSLEQKVLDKERSDHVKTRLESCNDSLDELSKKLQETQKWSTPKQRRQKILSEAQRLLYPFRKDTLTKLQTNVDHIRERLAFALQDLQLDVSTATEKSILHLSIQQQSDELRRIFDWLSAPDPWTNHYSARQQHQAQTGAWLLQCETYKSWKAGTKRHVWMHAKAGCGKTVLCSTAIEDIRAYSQTTMNTAFAIFYFSFSDDQKQTYENLMRSLVAQLGWKEPGLSMLRQVYKRPNPSRPGVDELEKIFCSSIESYDKVFLMLDALDESPEENDIRYNMLNRLERLVHSAQNISIFTTSREIPALQEAMKSPEIAQINIPIDAVNADIRSYASHEILRDPRFHEFTKQLQTEIVETLSQKADGM